MLLNIQFLRFVAAMLVVLYHTAAQVPDSPSVVHGLFALGQAIGFAGVDIFFVISGFIMAFTTFDQGGRLASAGFAGRRLARIYSGHWPFFVLTLIVFQWTRPAHVAESDLLASFLLGPLPLNRILLEISWTLTFELYFYALFALLVWLVPARKRSAICVAVTAGLLVLNLYRHFIADSFGPENLYFIPFAAHFLISPFLLEFFAGTLVAYWLQRKPSGRSTFWLVTGSVLFLLGGAVNTQVFAGAIEQGFYVLPRVLYFGLASVMIVTGVVRLENRSVKAPQRFSLATGGASYAIYLSHVLILDSAQKLGLGTVLSKAPFGLTTMGYLLLMLLIVAYSVWHYQHLERPLHRLFKRWIGIRTPRKPPG